MSRPTTRRVDASRLYLVGTVIAVVGCLVQLVIAVGHAPAALDALSIGAGGFAATTAAAAWLAEGRWRRRTAEALAAAVAALVIGPVLAHVHPSAVIAACAIAAVALLDGLREPRERTPGA